MFLNLRSFAPLLGAAVLVALAGCQVAPQNPDASAAPSSESAGQTPEQAELGAAPGSPTPASTPAPKLTPATNSPAAFFIGETHSAPNLTAVKMIDGTRLYLQREPVLKGADISQANDLVDKQGRHFVGVRFTKEGASKLADVSAKSKGKRLVLIINGRVEAAPVIGEQLDHGVLAFGVPSALGAASLAARIRGEQPPGLKFKAAVKNAVEEKAKAESESKADPKPEHRVEHKVEHKTEHKTEPRHKVESRHKPQPRHRVEHKVEHKTEPRHKAAPRHVEKPAAKPEPAKAAVTPKSDTTDKKTDQ